MVLGDMPEPPVILSAKPAGGNKITISEYALLSNRKLDTADAGGPAKMVAGAPMPAVDDASGQRQWPSLVSEKACLSWQMLTLPRMPP
jgi:hypothetical protein